LLYLPWRRGLGVVINIETGKHVLNIMKVLGRSLKIIGAKKVDNHDATGLIDLVANTNFLVAKNFST